MQKRQLFLAVMLILLSVLAMAQRETGTISGTVTDPTGAVITGAKVTAKSIATGAVRTATTQNGLYNIPDLNPGQYDVSIERTGFNIHQGRVQVTVGGTTSFNAAMVVGQGKSEVIEVTADNVVAINLESQTISNTINSKEITELPSLTRNIYDFVRTSGNVTEGPSYLGTRGAGVQINGQRSASTDLLLDGSENVDLFVSSVGQSVPLDSVQEFSVLTSNFTAEYGRAGGGVVNVATKSGTNNFHGSAYEFNRISALASNTPDNNDTIDPITGKPVKKSVFTRNQFGYALGGPIKKDKLFFFSSSEFTRVRSSTAEIKFVPDAAFLALTNANTQAFFSTFGKLRPGAQQIGTINAGDVKTALGITSGAFFTGVPNATTAFDKVTFNVPTDSGAGAPENGISTVNRVDYNFTDKTTLYGRYAYSRDLGLIGTVAFSPYAGYDTAFEQRNHNGQISLTHIFTPTIITDSKAVFNRFTTLQPLGTAPVSPTLYWAGATIFKVGNTALDNPGYLPESPGNAIPFGGPQNLYQFSQDLAWTKSKHQFRFGVGYIHMRDNRTFGAFEEAVEDLSAGSKTTAFNNFMAGTLNDFQAAVNPQGKFPCVRNLTTGALTTDPAQLAACTVTLPVGPPAFNRNNRYNDFSLFGQDSWKVTQSLTLNLGLRWEYYGIQHNADPTLESNFYFGSGATFFDQIRNGHMLTTPNSPNGNLWQPDYGDFAPRVGFAWDPFGHHKTSIRGGYGISYERNFGNVTFNVIQNPPNYFVLAVTPADVGGPISVTNNNAGPLAGTGSKLLPRSTGRIVDPNIHTAYAEFFSLALEHELSRNTVASVEYSGSNGIHLYDISNINQSGTGGVYEGDPVATNRLIPQFGNLNYRGSNGFSRYNGVNFKLQATNPFHSGVQFSFNYTISHSIDNLSTTFSESGNNFNLGYLDPFNPGLDKGPSDFDTRHRVGARAVWDIPWLKNHPNSILRQTLGGWSLAPIFTAASGSPYTIFDCTNAAFVRCPRLVPNGAIGSTGGSAGSSTKVAGQTNTYDWFTIPASTPYADTVTLSGEFPNCTGLKGVGCAWPTNMTGRNKFVGPGFWNTDLGIYKHIKVNERVGVQLRGEMYNLFNHHNFNLIAGNTDVSGASTVQVSKGGIRNVQLGAKITF